MKTHKIRLMSEVVFGIAFVLVGCGVISNTKMESELSESEEISIVQNTPDSNDNEQIEYWGTDEFENWMEQKHVENQQLVDKHEKSFYDKGANGDYYCREWTQEDVDTLYNQWQEQLTLMKQGYQFTKPISDDDGVISGVFGPEANEPPVSASGSTIVTLPDGSTIDLGQFDTVEESTKAVEKYLKQQVKEGKITQEEADKILSRGAFDE